MLATRLLSMLLKQAATPTQMNTSESGMAGLDQSPTQPDFAALMAKKPAAVVSPPAPGKLAPALARTMPKPSVPVGQHTPNIQK